MLLAIMDRSVATQFLQLCERLHGVVESHKAWLALNHDLLQGELEFERHQDKLSVVERSRKDVPEVLQWRNNM